ncbi:acyl-CoA dehydrogenase family protein [Aeromicrobium sp. YIM 150415]|uniref:acyl-CoA dehydrogenase family protein n=1 Tax=Aeromicrobium sp. YIM 150415 TaxID=2803912 RepID=UPI0019642795|nr:acyl-CoA dehydrogenase family protein [Aeromicrobium sp. YIM 150415]MBM9463580.1 acyl-CoA dehydrogenase family protein [Aeromicrobium sp. YIM 150415]
MALDAAWRGAVAELRAEVRSFLAEERERGGYRPMVDGWVQGVDPEFSRRLASRGWVGMVVPREYGGAGSTALRRWVVTDELLAAGAPVAAHWIGDRQVAPSLLRHGTEEQRRKFLPGIASAELIFCLGMSEPDAGSDLAAVRTRAERHPDGRWVLNGTKLWTSHAQVAGAILLLARSSPLGERRHVGLSQFLVELPRDGVSIRPIQTIDGKAHFNEVVFDDVALPEDALLGTEGEGWRQVTMELAYERSGPERISSSVPLLLAWGDSLRAEDQSAREEYAALIARLVMLRRMSVEIAAELEEGSVPETRAAMVKALGGEFEQRVVESVSRFFGAVPSFSGTELETQLAHGLTHAPTFGVRGGATDILLGIVAKSVGAR